MEKTNKRYFSNKTGFMLVKLGESVAKIRLAGKKSGGKPILGCREMVNSHVPAMKSQCNALNPPSLKNFFG